MKGDIRAANWFSVLINKNEKFGLISLHSLCLFVCLS